MLCSNYEAETIGKANQNWLVLKTDNSSKVKKRKDVKSS